MPQDDTEPTNEPANEPPAVRPEPTPSRRRASGWWYYVVLIASGGMAAWVPFLHLALRLGTVRARVLAILFGGLDAGLYVLTALTPQDSEGHATSAPMNAATGLLTLGIMVAGCVLITQLRRTASDDREIDEDVDPAIRAALAARARREESRQLAADDPLLARELHIGRPDLPRTYDDGGLVDLNSAPAATIATTCDIHADVAATIVATREARGEPFTNVDELFVLTDVPVATWDRIRDRAVLLP